MPYYIYKVTPGATKLMKKLEKIEQHESYKAARDSARSMRGAARAAGGDENHTIKVMFADSELAAEELLMEKREEQILREWEK